MNKGLLAYVLLLSLVVLLLSQQARSQQLISAELEKYCCTCLQKEGCLRADTLFGTLIAKLDSTEPSMIHIELQDLLLQNEFVGRDTLYFLSRFLLAHIKDKLGLEESSIQLFEALSTEAFRFDQGIALKINSELGSSYIHKGWYDKALDQYRYVMQSHLFQEDSSAQDATYIGMGLCFHYQKPMQSDSAIHYFEKAIEVQLVNNDSGDLGRTYLNLGSLYFDLYQDNKAKRYWEKAREIGENRKALSLLGDVNFNLALLYEEKEQPALALQYYKQYIQYQDSMWNRDRLWELAEQKRLYEVALKEERIDGLNKDKRLQAAELDRKQTTQNVLAGVLAGVLAITYLIYRLYKNSRSKNEIINKQKVHLDELNATKDKLFSIVAHDLRGPVQSLGKRNAMLLFKMNKGKADELKSDLEENSRTIAATYRLLDNVLHWALSQYNGLRMNLEVHRLKRITDQVLYDYEGMADQKKIVLQNTIDPSISVVADAEFVKIVLRNLLDNALRYTPDEGVIKLTSVNQSEEYFTWGIHDSGPGIDSDTRVQLFTPPGQGEKSAVDDRKKGTGLGLYLCKELMMKMGGNIKLDEDNTEGTHLLLTLKMK